ncbi:MAG TPA: hypothetical protein VFW46_18950, partial [Stellaceae bacterium]|nr:hypothetical protein [Stellaceae bacterium]
PDTDGLSVISLEFFGGDKAHNLSGVKSVMNLSVRRSHRLLVLNVGDILSTGPLRVEYDPDESPPPNTNAAHCLVKGPDDLTDDVREALTYLAGPNDIEGFFPP